MNAEELILKVKELDAAAEFDTNGEWPVAFIHSANWKTLAGQLRYDETLYFDYLFCLTCIDYKTHLTMVYHLTSTRFRHVLVVKSKLERSNPEIDTVSDIWRTAEYHEREVFDLFGVRFLNHPNLKRLLLEDSFIGFPLRKDFEDPINMIKL